MAITGLSTAERNWFVTRDDPGKRDTLEDSIEAGATIFYYRAIPNKTITRIHDMQSSASVVMGEQTTQTFHQKVAGKNREAFRFGVTGWDNFHDELGEPIAYETEITMEGMASIAVIAEKTMDRVRLQTINEVGAHVFNRNSLGEDDRKKFEALLSEFEGSGDGSAESAPNKTDANEDAKDQQNTSDAKPTKKQPATRKPAKSTKPK